MRRTMGSSWLVSAITTITALVGCGGSASQALVEAGPAADSGGDAPGDVSPLPAPNLSDLQAVSGIAVFQGTKADVVKDGARPATPNAPVVAGRPGLLRVYLTPQPAWRSHQLVAELHLLVGGVEVASHSDKKFMGKPSNDAELTTTFVYDLSAVEFAVGTSYFVTIHAADGDAAPFTGTLRYPADGADDLGVVGGAETVRVQIVPIKYDTDASGRLGNVTADQLERYRSALYRMYPTAKVEVTAHAPMPWTTAILADGTGWDDLLQGLIDLRQGDGAPDDLYYVAAMRPAASFGKFCSGGCVLGVAPQTGPTDVAERVAAVVDYDGDEAASTLLQELAHAMGRGHAPCGPVDAPDKRFPYSDGGIGVWGWDIEAKTLVKPSDYSDIMSYCQPTWISDYTFNGLFKRIVGVNKAAAGKGTMSKKSYRPLHVAGDGSLRARPLISIEAPVPGAEERRRVSFRDASGRTVLETTGTWHPYDHIPGGIVLVEEPSQHWASVTIGTP